jgi:hypothetical protein
MYQYLPQARYDVLKQDLTIAKADASKIGDGFEYHPHKKMWNGSVTMNLNDTKNYNVRSHPEFEEHSHRQLIHTKPPYKVVEDNARDTENIEDIIKYEKKESTHGTVKNDGLNFFKY